MEKPHSMHQAHGFLDLIKTFSGDLTTVLIINKSQTAYRENCSALAVRHLANSRANANTTERDGKSGRDLLCFFSPFFVWKEGDDGDKCLAAKQPPKREITWLHVCVCA